MLKSVLLVTLIFAASSSDLAAPTPSLSFLQGFLAGLGGSNESGPCGTALNSLTNGIYSAWTALDTKNQNLQDVINDLNSLQAVVNAFEQTDQSCNLSGLKEQLSKILSPGGFSILVQNYLNNGEEIFSDYKEIQTCSSNYYQCGFAYGNAFEALVGWSLD